MTTQKNNRMIPRAVGILLAFTSLVGGCDCSSAPGLQPIPDWVCVDQGGTPGPDDSPCPNGGRFIMGTCMELRCDAYEEGDNCCPGMLCKQSGECVVPAGRIETCTTDTDCEVMGHECFERPSISTESLTCGPRPQNAAGGCDNGGSAFNSRCVKQAPCDGSCDEGKVCNIDTDSCETPPMFATDESCQQSCGDSSLLVYADPDTMLFDSCCEITCECLTLPPLAPGVYGRFSDLAVDDTQVVISSYDTTYGDLVASSHNLTNGLQSSMTYIDGIPLTGTTVADPAGPRGGLIEGGPDRGQHTSIALFNGVPSIAYYDVDEQDLRYAQYDSTTDAWAVTTIHSDGDVGRYTSLLIDEAGIAHVSYYAHRISATTEDGVHSPATTGPYYARARSTAPTGPEDWEVIPIEVVPSCHGSCTAEELCVEIAAQPQCVLGAADCDSCEAHQSCVQSDGGAQCKTSLPHHLEIPCGDQCSEGDVCVLLTSGASTCAATADESCGECELGSTCAQVGAQSPQCHVPSTYTPLAGIPEGVGLYTSLALYNGSPMVSYYDRVRTHLRGATAQFTSDGDLSAGFVSSPLVSISGEDVGQQSKLAIHPGGMEFSISYQGLGGETLWLYTAEDMHDFSGETELVDDGVRETSVNLVGASSSPAYDADGNLYIAYADQTDNDLVLADKLAGTWTNTPILSSGAVGSFARLVIHNNIGYVSTYMRMRDSTDQDISELKVLLLDLNDLVSPGDTSEGDE